MSKSSRFWWLHGMILLSAVVGCKSSSCSSGGCGPAQGGPPPVAGGSAYPMTGAMGSGYADKYGNTGAPMYQGSSPGGGQMTYPTPTTSTGMYPGGLGSAH